MSAARNAVRVTIGGEEYTVRSELPPAKRGSRASIPVATAE
jgi:hypothetical protein